MTARRDRLGVVVLGALAVIGLGSLVLSAILAEPLEGPPPPNAQGRFLVAAPGASSFTETVIVVLRHDEGGAWGLVVNQPTDEDLASRSPELAARSRPPAMVFDGGPVAPDDALALVVAPPVADLATVPAGEIEMRNLGVVDVEADAEPVRVFDGRAGWDGGQLDGEIRSGRWLVVDGTLAEVFDPEPETLWERLVARAGT